MKKETKRMIIILYLICITVLTLSKLFHIWTVQLYIGMCLAILSLIAGAGYFPYTSGRMPWRDQKQLEDQIKHPIINYKTYLVLALPLIISFLILISQ